MPLSALLAIPLVMSAVTRSALLAQGSSLSAAAAASGRPPECSSGSRRALAKGPSVWELARVPNLQRYCDLMARAHAELPTMPDAARRAAEEADKALPGRAAPAVVLARAALAIGTLEEAARAFERARSVDPRSVEDPSTMHDLARVLWRTGKRDEALGVYRALVPRIDLLGTVERRVSVLLEAAHVSMTVEGAGGAPPKLADLAHADPKRAKARLDEAIAYLREARQRPPTQLAGDVMLSLALTLDRAGLREEADAALAEAAHDGGASAPSAAPPSSATAAKPRAAAPTAPTASRAFDYVAVPEDRGALEALALENTDRPAAQKAWDTYLAGPGGKGPWATAARARLDALKKGGGRAPSAPAKKRAK